MSEDQNGDKTFAPTQHRREQFKKEGRFARARDASAVLSTAAVLATLLGSRETMGHAMRELFARTLGDAGALARGDGPLILQSAGAALSAIALPAAIAAAVAATGAGLAQSGLRINTDALGFDLSRLNPIPKLGDLFSPKRGTVELVMGLLRVGVVGYVAYRTLVLEIPALIVLGRMPLADASARLIDAAVRVLTTSLGALMVIAGADYAQSRFRLELEMMMTRQEMKEEMRSQDGDPKIKARMRAFARALAKKNALANVKKADVIVANPTHIAVALRYSETDPAPVVIAKGHDDVAMQIRAEARKHGIPVLENRPLARALDAEVRIGQAVPAAHFAAVARVLAFVYRLRGGRRGTRRA